MNELEILKSIGSNLTDRKTVAALSNFDVLCNNITFLNDAFVRALKSLRTCRADLQAVLSVDSNLNTQYQSGADLNAFVPIVDRLQLNGHSVFQKLADLSAPVDRNGITVENVSFLARGFDDYNTLVTATRQYVDSVVSDSYQLVLLDPKALNYHVLVSLNSFSKYATKSLAHALFNSDVQAALAEFENLKFKDWAKSGITECKHKTFGNKVDFLFSELGLHTELSLTEDIKSLFKFSSEFTHIGYVSTFFTATAESEVIFGDDTGPYLPSTENHSELQYKILVTACQVLASVYMPSLIRCVGTLTENSSGDAISETLRQSAESLTKDIASRNAEYYFFIKSGLIGSSFVFPLTCMCGSTRNWDPPHESSKLYCESCGSSFKLMEVDGNGGYVITSSGPARIIGSDAPEFQDLPVTEQEAILKQCEPGNEHPSPFRLDCLFRFPAYP